MFSLILFSSIVVSSKKPSLPKELFESSKSVNEYISPAPRKSSRRIILSSVLAFPAIITFRIRTFSPGITLKTTSTVCSFSFFFKSGITSTKAYDLSAISVLIAFALSRNVLILNTSVSLRVMTSLIFSSSITFST